MSNKPAKRVVFDAFPNQQTFIEKALSGKYRILVYGGAIRGGKTFVLLALFMFLCRIYPGSRWAIVRKNLKRLKQNTRPSINKLLSSNWTVKEAEQRFIYKNGSEIMFIPENIEKDPTLEAFKGLEVNGFGLEEVSELRLKTFEKCKERAGTYIISPTPKNGQPKPLTIMTVNPTKTWVKDVVYDPWKIDKLPGYIYYLQARAHDNPHVTQDQWDQWSTMSKYEYMVFVEGNWDVTLKTPNAFWYNFDTNKHVFGVFPDPKKPIHVSIDSNALPYCTATFWQIDQEQKTVFQIAEVCAKDPYNQASGLAQLCGDYLDDIEYDEILQVYGDQTTKSQNTIDPKGRAFFQIFVEEIEKKYRTIDRITSSNPPVIKTAQFVNHMLENYDGWDVQIAETCKFSISDYLTVQKSDDGTMAKPRIKDDSGNSYEEFGHISDTMRYFFYSCLNSVYYKWDNRHSTPGKFEAVEIEDNIFDEN